MLPFIWCARKEESVVMDTKQTGINSTTELARVRTREAADRTLLAWIRTSLPLIGFGFTANKVLGVLEAGKSASCGGYLVYLFSHRPLSRNDQHERHAGSFPVRHQSHLQRCGEILSSQAHVATQSAIRKRVYHLPGFLSLTFDHRAVDGAPAAAFLQTSGQRLENPVELTRSNSIQESRLN